MMMKRKRGPRKKSKAAQIGSALLLSIAAFQLLTSEGGDGNGATHGSKTTFFLRRMLSEPDSSSEETEPRRPRPRMYTFYHHVPTQAKESTDQETLDVWKEEWTRAGFDAQVLTLDDATSHPNFNSYKQTLQDSVALHRPIGYNQMCFYRWLAMATVGGGFMSDYDALPLQGSYDMAIGLRDELPNDGKFTVYDRHVPSLMAGSAEEWDRLSAKLLDAAIAQTSGEEEIGDGSGTTSDMVALLAVIHRGTGKEKPDGEDDVVEFGPDRVFAGSLMRFDDFNEIKCTQLRRVPAVHFSHAAISRDYGAHVSQRPDIMRRWHKNWRGICRSNGAKDDENSGEDREEGDDSRPARQSMFESTLRFHKAPDLSRFQCELSYRKHPEASWGWHRPVENPKVPAGSRFDVNNNFLTDIFKSNLNIFFMGDSVGENLADFFLDALGDDSNSKSDEVFKENMQGVEQSVYWAKKLPEDKGSGTIAFARMLRMWKEKNKGDSDSFRGWEPQIFEDHVKAHGNVDVFVYRLPWPWMFQEGSFLPPNLREIKDSDVAGELSESDYDEVVSMAQKYLRPHTVILVTTPVNNNGIKDGFKKLRKDNEAMRSYVKNFVPPENPSDGVQSVLLLDWEKLVDAAILANAEVLGIKPEKAFYHSLTGVNIEESKKRQWYPQLTAMTCSGTTSVQEPQWSNECPEDRMGLVSPDGMHLCGATIGPRSSGGLACLMKCSIGADEHGLEYRTSFLEKCQNKCNGLFMNMDTFFVAHDKEGQSGHLEIQ